MTAFLGTVTLTNRMPTVCSDASSTSSRSLLFNLTPPFEDSSASLEPTETRPSHVTVVETGGVVTETAGDDWAEVLGTASKAATV